ncbi:hypothetical protein TCDM_10819 [Trypanosoma cruzi Dm28c]|uniref:Uncharacterized protein n=1 Tax=Trypanosoma cruzi Dm28c TaxID=1416333 RepID=V5ALM3_TRYCR|nr:hypothetical protein TCDM_10819 [Trypanosoma cruzi Dm28c]KAF8306131.1 hypothetical protein TcBrA4_0034870 [Trypanosoma cruzi]KAF8306134.1 hypothetical protein TcBrA4_0034690 [Trypanosoma cruzi]PBJ74544.1 hypothetical protein BCY84_12433 [Trypanosoma cruzi cruzi]PBJ81335.1 hypothetical protein BCY84_00208 [Trypanosoma cruzi cruzi]
MIDAISLLTVIFVCFGVSALLLWGGIFFCHRYKLFTSVFGEEGEEVRGIPLRSQAPPIPEEERRRNLQRAQRRQRRLARRQQPQAAEEEADGNIDSNDGGSDGSAMSLHTRGSNSRWFRTRYTADSLSCTTVASSGAVYGHGNYLSRQNTTAPPSPLSQISGNESCGSATCRSRRQRRNRNHRHRLRKRDSSKNDGGNPNNNSRCSPFGGWAEDSLCSCSSCMSSNEAQDDDKRHVEVEIVSPRAERQRFTRRHIIEQNAAMSGFFTAPAIGWSHEPYAGPHT